MLPLPTAHSHTNHRADKLLFKPFFYHRNCGGGFHGKRVLEPNPVPPLAGAAITKMSVLNTLDLNPPTSLYASCCAMVLLRLLPAVSPIQIQVSRVQGG